VSAIRDRRCITSGIKDKISAYDLLTCCDRCHDSTDKDGQVFNEKYKFLFLDVLRAIWDSHSTILLVRELLQVDKSVFYSSNLTLRRRISQS
jgi:hypothetical protein